MTTRKKKRKKRRGASAASEMEHGVWEFVRLGSILGERDQGRIEAFKGDGTGCDTHEMRFR